jgi:hypothetical protein
MTTRTESLHSTRQAATAPSARARRSRLRAIPALAVGALLAVAAAQPAAAGADDRDRGRDDWRRGGDRWEHRGDRHDRDRWRDRDRHRDRRDRKHWDRGRHDRRHWDRDRHDRRWDRRWDDRHDRRFRVPGRLGAYRDYDRYYHGRVYHRAHRHHHRVYAFPVFVRGAVHYEPYAYCDDAFFQRGAFYYDGPRLSIRWGF